MKRLILLMHCPDKKGIIAAVTNFIHQRNGNIVYISISMSIASKGPFL